MAKESFDKEIQFLRMLVLTSGAFNRQQFAERLGISVHTFDKTIRRLKEVASSLHHHLPQAQSKEWSETLRYNYYESADPLLLFLFRAKSVKESEGQRISLLLAAMNDQAWTRWNSWICAAAACLPIFLCLTRRPSGRISSTWRRLESSEGNRVPPLPVSHPKRLDSMPIGGRAHRFV